MVGCCNIGPCKKKRSYEFNNPGYESNKAGGTYRQSQLVEEEEETKANGAAKLQGYASHSGDSVDGDQEPGIKGVVAVELDSNSDSESSPGKRDSKDGKNSKRSSKRSRSSSKGSKRGSKRSDKEDDNRSDSGVTSGETSVIRVKGVRGSVHDSESGERSSKTDGTIEAGATPYPDESAERSTTTTTTYTTVIRHRVDGTGDDDDDAEKRISNVSSRSSSTPRVISSYDPTKEGHFHSEHQYTVELTPGKRISSTSDDSRHKNQEHGSEIGSVTTERSSVMVNVPAESEELDNVANKLAEDMQDEDEEWHTVTEVTETVIHINSPVEIGESHRYSSNDFAM